MRVSKILLSLASVVLSLNAFAGPSFQPPVPIKEENVTRLAFGPYVDTNYTQGLQYFNGGFGAAFRLAQGFEAGIELIAGAGNAQGKNMLASPQNQMPGMGGYAMVRYLGGVTELFFLGFELQFGYVNTLPANGKLGVFNIGAGIPFDFTFGEAASFYFMPEFNVGVTRVTNRTGNSEVVANIGGEFRVGTLISLGIETVQLMLEVKPKLGSFQSNPPAGFGFSTDYLLGLAFNI